MSQINETINSSFSGRLEVKQRDSLTLTFSDTTTGTLVIKTPGIGVLYRVISGGRATLESDCFLEVGIYEVDLITTVGVTTSFEIYAELTTITQGADMTIDKDMLKDALKEMDLNKEENFVTTSPVTNPIGKIQTGYSKTEADKVSVVNVLNDMLHKEEVHAEYTVLVIDTSLLTDKNNTVTINESSKLNSYGIRFQNVTNPIIDWGDGTVENITTNESHTHTYEYTGIYTVKTNLGISTSNKVTFGQHATFKQSLIEVDQISSNYIGCMYLFYECTNLRKVNCKIPESIVNCSSMFSKCSSLKEAPSITDNVGSASSMYAGCSNLETITNMISTFNNLKSTNKMFANCINLINIPTNITLNKCTDCDSMFQNCNKLQSMNIKLNAEESQRVTNMFVGCTNLTNVSIQFNSIVLAQQSYDFTAMFKECISLMNADIKIGLSASASVSNSNVTITIKQMCYNCKNLVRPVSTVSLAGNNISISLNNPDYDAFTGCDLLNKFNTIDGNIADVRNLINNVATNVGDPDFYTDIKDKLDEIKNITGTNNLIEALRYVIQKLQDNGTIQ